MYYFFRDRDQSDELKRLIKETHEPGSLAFTTPQVAIKKDLYEERVERAKEYVAAGDIFQVVLSKRLDFKIDGDLMKFYSVLRNINPSPYMYFLKMGSQKIIGSSPEMLVKVTKQLVETYPIAGTRPRLEDPVKNQALANELLEDPKERAEHV
ncbi:MAG: chorismate-binding protein, partial [Candidatus Heimdallarchaeota archaeon]|nr:chorismate-binding protein [Candidatus Heimdallarchaeota archaeon]